MSADDPSTEWDCPACAARVEAGFAVCWNCGTGEDGTADPHFRRADAPPDDAGRCARSGFPLALLVIAVLSLMPFVFVENKVDAEVSWPATFVLLAAFGGSTGLLMRCLLQPSGSGLRSLRGEAHCYSCLEPISPLQHYCGNCTACVGQYTPYLPFERIPYMAQFFGRLIKMVCRGGKAGWARRVACLVLVGALLSPVLAVLLILADMTVRYWSEEAGGGTE